MRRKQNVVVGAIFFFDSNNKGTFGLLKCLFNRLCEPGTQIIINFQPVDNYFDIVFDFAIKLDVFTQSKDFLISPCTNKPFALKIFEKIFVLAFLATNQRSKNKEFSSFG